MSVPAPIPPILDGAGSLLRRYDVLFCDVWGVLVDGVSAYPGANDALPRFREAGGTVVLLSNAPLPSDHVATFLRRRGVRDDAFDAIVSSGDLARARMAELGATAVHHIGPPRDEPLFDEAGIRRVPMEDAGLVVATGLRDDAAEQGEDYRRELEPALRRELELVCANPDLVVEVGDRHYPCAGAIAAVYEAMGGRVFWGGKPFAVAYAAAMRVAQGRRGGPVDPARVLAIGDAVRTDLAGAAGAGIDALFVTGGIHREAVTVDGRVDPGRLAALMGPQTRTTVAAIPALRW